MIDAHKDCIPSSEEARERHVSVLIYTFCVRLLRCPFYGDGQFQGLKWWDGQYGNGSHAFLFKPIDRSERPMICTDNMLLLPKPTKEMRKLTNFSVNPQTKILVCLLSMLWLTHLSLYSQVTKEVVEITVPGTLEEVINNLESSRFESLTIKGGLNAADFAYLNSGKDKVAMIETLDLSDVTLVPGDQPYNTVLVGRDGGAFGYFYNIYYISDTYQIYEESHSSGLGGSNRYSHIFCNDLSGVFSKNEAFEKVILPKSLTNVGEYMFSNYSSTNNTLKEIVLPENANTIGNWAFKDCQALEKVELPNTLTAIGTQAFYNTAIKELILPTTVKHIGKSAFEQSEISTINLENVESIEADAFAYAKNLIGEINISKLDTVHARTFYSTNISEISFSPSLQVIEESAFGRGWGGYENDYPRFQVLNLPDGIEKIGVRAFEGCKMLGEIRIPASIRQIGNYAFEGTPWVNSIRSENGVRYIANVAYNYDNSYMPQSDTFAFRDGTIAISDGFAFPSDVKEIVKHLQLPESLIEIGNNAFSNFNVLGEVKLPSSLKRIGQQAFAECPKFWCTLPESLETLEYRAFYNCKTLSQVTLPENLRYIEGEVFTQSAVGTVYVNSRALHYQLQDWEMGSPHTIFGEHSSLKKAIIGPQVTRLYDWMFAYTTSLNTVEFVDSDNSNLIYIGDYCFNGCASYMTDYVLVINNLPSSIKHIGNRAFPACTLPPVLNLKSIKYLGSDAFSYSNGVETVIVPETVETFGGAVFYNSSDLRHVEFNAAGYTTIPCYKDGYYYDSPEIFAHCNSLKTVKIGANVTNLTRGMFVDCRNLESVEFMTDDTRLSSPLTINDYAFAWCTNLTSIELPERVDSIGGNFIYGAKVQSLNVPSSCKYLGTYVFDYCPLESIYFNSEVPPTFGGPITDRSWEYAQELTIYVPDVSLEFYRSEADLWKYNLVGLPTSSVDDLASSEGNFQITAVYDLNGRNVIKEWSEKSKGIYILKLSDGTSRKVIR